MNDISNLGGLTGQLVRMALDASLMRHQVIANNIANANTHDYAPVRINFEEQLALEKVALLDRNSDAMNATRIDDIKARIEPVGLNTPAGVSSSVLVDMEMANMARNVVHYQALLEGRAKKGAIIKMAINGGRN